MKEVKIINRADGDHELSGVRFRVEIARTEAERAADAKITVFKEEISCSECAEKCPDVRKGVCLAHFPDAIKNAYPGLELGEVFIDDKFIGRVTNKNSLPGLELRDEDYDDVIKPSELLIVTGVMKRVDPLKDFVSDVKQGLLERA